MALRAPPAATSTAAIATHGSAAFRRLGNC
jgi:hypothetical protein